MKQYCRYCANCHYGDFVYCEVIKNTMREEKAKRPNKCKHFVFNPLDVFCPFDENGEPRVYKPQKYTKKERNEIIDNNLKQLLDFEEN